MPEQRKVITTPLGVPALQRAKTLRRMGVAPRDINAPATVAPGANFDIVIDPAPNTIPGNVNGYTVKRVEQ